MNNITTFDIAESVILAELPIDECLRLMDFSFPSYEIAIDLLALDFLDNDLFTYNAIITHIMGMLTVVLPDDPDFVRILRNAVSIPSVIDEATADLKFYLKEGI